MVYSDVDGYLFYNQEIRYNLFIDQSILVLSIALQCLEDYIYMSNKAVWNAVKLNIVTDIIHPILDNSEYVFIQLVCLSCKILLKSTFWNTSQTIFSQCSRCKNAITILCD